MSTKEAAPSPADVEALPAAPGRSTGTPTRSSTVGVSLEELEVSAGMDNDKSFEETVAKLEAREKELCSFRRMLTEEDVLAFAETHRVLSLGCSTDIQTMAVIGRLQRFLVREEVARTLATKRAPGIPGLPTIVERFPDGLLVRWKPAAENEADSNLLHYELQYGFRFLGGWQAVRPMSIQSIQSIQSTTTRSFLFVNQII